MPAYAYSARTGKGRSVKGMRVVATEGELAASLAAEGLFLVRSERFAPRASKARIRFAPRDLAVFLLHVATYLEAGLSLLAALQDYKDPDSPALEAAVADLTARLSEGTSLSEAMEAHPALFRPVHVAMVRAGEATGRLDQAIRALLRLVEWENGFRAQVRKAGTYPLVLLSVLALVMLLVCTYSLPPILELLVELRIPLPLVTRVFLAIGGFLSSYGWMMVAGAVAIRLAAKLALRSPRVRLAWDRLLLDLPVAGRLALRMAMARFAHFCAAQYRAGIPLVQALRNSEDVTGNERVRRAILELRMGVEQGWGLAVMATQVGLFPQMIIRMFVIGEETGKLDEALDKAALFYDAEVEEGVRLFFQVLDPALKVVLGALLVFVGTAVLLPLYQLIGGINA